MVKQYTLSPYFLNSFWILILHSLIRTWITEDLHVFKPIESFWIVDPDLNRVFSHTSKPAMFFILDSSIESIHRLIPLSQSCMHTTGYQLSLWVAWCYCWGTLWWWTKLYCNAQRYDLAWVVMIWSWIVNWYQAQECMLAMRLSLQFCCSQFLVFVVVNSPFFVAFVCVCLVLQAPSATSSYHPSSAPICTSTPAATLKVALMLVFWCLCLIGRSWQHAMPRRTGAILISMNTPRWRTQCMRVLFV
jgi:hypothetical protein